MSHPADDILFVASHVRPRAGSLAPAARRAVVAVALGAALLACIGMFVARGGYSTRPAELFGIYIPSMDADAPHAAILREEFTGRQPDLQEHLDQVLDKARTTMGSSAPIAPRNTPITQAAAVKLFNPVFDPDNPAVARRSVAHEVKAKAIAVDNKMKARLNLEAKVAMLTQRSSTMLVLQKFQKKRELEVKREAKTGSDTPKHKPWREGPPVKPSLKAFQDKLRKRLDSGEPMDLPALEKSEKHLDTRYGELMKSYARWKIRRKALELGGMR